ncbi:Lipase maturation factor 1 [Brachionus plicatilis]|uniref:Lipase maturation factor n=1 Tax=Brachionus plicatilis TaxID=10195 RepID=A0A3M7PJJ3_BRAPC|nr:Lipase maturation factor 1 [Brachionus plicatilis]
MDRIFSDFKAKSNPFKGLLDDRLWKKIHLYIYLPTLFWFSDWTNHINQILNYSALIGLTLALIIVIRGSANSIILLIMWLLYHSIVNIGQTWYSFGWESQVLESGFIAIFLVPFISLKKVDIRSPPSLITIYLYRWLIFRIMIGAGLIKLRGDKCWKDLTCMNYFYETQPVPNPVSFYLHKEPEGMHKFEVLSNHFIELIAPFLVLMPIRILRLVGGWIQIIFQIILIMSGNLSFLNWLTILPSLACFDDFHLKFFFSCNQDSPLWNLLKDQYLDNVKTESLVLKRIAIEKKVKSTINLMVLTLVAYLSIPVVLNLVSEKQAMNTSFEPFRIVNTYGAFGSVTKERYEVIFKGTNEKNLQSDRVEWFEYEFMCKPGNVNRTPCLISPYHYRLDWLMWFAAFQVLMKIFIFHKNSGSFFKTYEYNPWLLSMTAKFLLNDKNFTSQMIAFNPFENKEPPKQVISLERRINLINFK